MDVWWNNHFLYKDLESSNGNNHKKWMFRVPGIHYIGFLDVSTRFRSNSENPWTQKSTRWHLVSWTHQGEMPLNMCVLNGRKIQLLTIGFPLRPQIKPSFLSGVKNVVGLGGLSPSPAIKKKRVSSLLLKTLLECPWGVYEGVTYSFQGPIAMITVIVSMICTRWFSSWPNFIPDRWRSLNLWTGHLTIPKRSLWITWYFRFGCFFSLSTWGPFANPDGSSHRSEPQTNGRIKKSSTWVDEKKYIFFLLLLLFFFGPFFRTTKSQKKNIEKKTYVFFLNKESNGTINAVLGVDEVLADDFSDLIPPMYGNLLTSTIKIKQM